MSKQESKHVLAGEVGVYHQFPVDEYVDCCIIAYNIADLPASQYAQTNDPVPSVRFLMAGYTDEGQVVRKWTNWVRISYHKKARLSSMFQGFPNLANMLQDDDNLTSSLWTTPMKILLEDNKTFSNIIRVKPGDNKAVLGIVYDAEYVPFKYVKAFGQLVNLRLAVLKTKNGVERYSPDDMLDPPEDSPYSPVNNKG